MNKDNGPIPTSPLFALINKDSYGSVNRSNNFSINSASSSTHSRIKFLVKLGRTVTEAYAILKEVYGNACLFCTQIFESSKRFKEGR
ncbi:hypothetical protein NQ318_019015 [Aromia moschata]|uniref:Uncharacterized protein n=1 Tax=Aromia moschata TaxID=1265417 RepID=A0AAV8XJW5_9CUCU|nr:hypothetical protein NQ318_019015 [Aromia moschata]